jgi:ribonuclease PH
MALVDAGIEMIDMVTACAAVWLTILLYLFFYN